MHTHKIAAVGEEDIVLGFKALGIEIYPVDGPEATTTILSKLLNSDEYGIVFVSESMADGVEELMTEIGSRPLPSLVYIPGSKGSQGFAMQRMRKIIERAVGADILSGKEVE
jgi:V/A-type H+-transporting ATPase subunit F